MFGKRTLSLALPIPWLITLAVALIVLWGLVSFFGPTTVVLFGWLAAWLITSRAVNWLVSQRRKALRPKPPSSET